MDIHKLLILRSALVNQLNSKGNNKDKIILECIKKHNYQYAFLNSLFDIDEEKLILIDYYIKSVTSQHKDIKKYFLIKQCQCPEIIVDYMSGNHEIKKMMNSFPIISSNNNTTEENEDTTEEDEDEDEDDDNDKCETNEEISVNLFSNENTTEQITTQNKSTTDI